MALDQAIVVEVHCLDEIHLLAFAGVTRVFPDQPLQRKSNHEDASPGSASRVCNACAKRGADIRPDFNWNRQPGGEPMPADWRAP